MPQELVTLFDYIIHEGEIEGSPACALLWTGSQWEYVSDPQLSTAPGGGGYIDLKIQASEGSLLLKSVDKRLLKLIVVSGLHVIYRDASGSTQNSFIPPANESGVCDGR